jgi:hypothetical protein
MNGIHDVAGRFEVGVLRRIPIMPGCASRSGAPGGWVTHQTGSASFGLRFRQIAHAAMRRHRWVKYATRKPNAINRAFWPERQQNVTASRANSHLASRGLRASAPGEDAKPHPAGITTLDRCRYNLRGASVRKAEAQPGAIGRRCSHSLQGSDVGCESMDEDRSGPRSCAGSWKNVGTERGPRSRQAPRMITSRLMFPMERIESWRQNWS